MLIVDDLALFPVRGLFWIFKEIHKAAEEEQKAEGENIIAELTRLHTLLESGEIDEDEFDLREGELLDRLDEIRERENAEAAEDDSPDEEDEEDEDDEEGEEDEEGFSDEEDSSNKHGSLSEGDSVDAGNFLGGDGTLNEDSMDSRDVAEDENDQNEEGDINGKEM